MHSNGGGGEGTITFPFANLPKMLYFELLRCVCGLARWYYWCIAVHFRFLASNTLHVPCIMQNLSVFHDFSHGLGRKIRYHEMEQKLCAWMAARRNKRVIVTKNMCLAFARKWDSASDTEIVWAKSARGVWGLANFFANGSMDPEPDDCMNEHPIRAVPALCVEGTKPQPAAKAATKAAKPRAKPSKHAAKPSMQPNLQLESPFPWPLLSMCSSLRRNTRVKKSDTPSLLLSRPDMHPCRQFSGHFVVTCPRVRSLVLCCASLV